MEMAVKKDQITLSYKLRQTCKKSATIFQLHLTKISFNLVSVCPSVLLFRFLVSLFCFSIVLSGHFEISFEFVKIPPN